MRKNKSRTPTEISIRIERLRAAMQAKGHDVALINDRANSFYFSGFSCSNSVIVVGLERAVFLTDFRYIELAQRALKDLEVRRMTQDGTAELSALLHSMRPQTIAFEPTLTFAQHMKFRKAAGRARFLDAGDLFTAIRAIKSRRELALIAANQAETGELFESLISSVAQGQAEQELRLRLRIEMLGRGVEEAFDTIVATGPNSSIPHAVSGTRRLRANEFLLVDMGVKNKHYHSDMTRTVVAGRPSARHLEIYKIVLEAQQRALDVIRDGVAAREVDAAARDYIASKGYGDYFGHGLGHGVGLEIHEAPTLNLRSTQVLAENMVITVEPGIYIPRFGGVRIEDLVIVTKTGHRNVTRVPKELRII